MLPDRGGHKKEIQLINATSTAAEKLPQLHGLATAQAKGRGLGPGLGPGKGPAGLR